MNNLLLLLMLLSWRVMAGPLERVQNTTITLPPAPPAIGYSATNALGSLTFDSPVYATFPPGETNRLFIVERAGRIMVVTNLAAPTKTEFFSLAGRVLTNVNNGMMSLAFHPGYATNRFFFVVYSLNTTTTNVDGSLNSNNLHQRLARFETSSTNENYAAPLTELPLYTERDVASVHDPNDIQFGPDGYLYVSRPFEGPNTPGGDPLKHTQQLDRNLFGGFLRLDVDKLPGSLAPNPHHSHHPIHTSYTNSYGIPAGTVNYGVPADNPFLGAISNPDGTAITNTGELRTEFWAVGLRNPFRFCFDEDGALICGDVGYNTADEVNVITAGGNCGWPFIEGDVPGPRESEAPPGFTAVPPVLALPIGDVSPGSNFVSRALIGGAVYRGTQFPELAGKYIFGDNWQGTIWAATLDDTNAATVEYLFTDAIFGPVHFTRHPASGELLWVNFAGTVNRLVYAPVTNDFPATLADTGVFADLATLTPNPGVVPYGINVPFWSDGALKSRWFSVPDTNLTLAFNPVGNWAFPTGTVWVKHFELELTNGSPASRRRLETRLLVQNETGVYGVTYRWDGAATNALLVPAGGLADPLILADGGNLRTQVWTYPGRSACLACHNPISGGALGFRTEQLNCEHDYSGVVTNQLAALAAAGYFTHPLTNLSSLPRLARGDDATVSREFRVRSYLSANCAYCHQPGGPTPGLWDGRITTGTAGAKLIEGELADDQGDPASRVVVRGDLAHSMLLGRINTTGGLRMPPIGSSVVDPEAVGLLSAWITNDLPDWRTFAEWQGQFFGSTNVPSGQAGADPDGDGAVNELEFMTGTVPTNALSVWSLGMQLTNGAGRIDFPRLANRSFELQTRTNLLQGEWLVVESPQNVPFFAATNGPGRFTVGTTNRSAEFFRVRISSP